MAIKLLNDEKLILNREVSAGQDVSAVAIVQHNYPALSNQAKLMITGKFDIAQQHLYKAGSEPYNAAGELIDYSGEGNDAQKEYSYGMNFIKTPLNYATTDTGFELGAGDFYIRYKFKFVESGSISFFLSLTDDTSTSLRNMYFYHYSNYGDYVFGAIRLGAAYEQPDGCPIYIGDVVDIELYRIGNTMYFKANNITQNIVVNYSISSVIDWSNSNYVLRINNCRNTMSYIPKQEFYLLEMGYSKDNLTHKYTGSSYNTDIIYDLIGSLDFMIFGKYTGFYDSFKYADTYNLTNGFRKISNDGGSTIVYQPRLFDDSGFPALPSGYTVISTHLAGTFHNQAETKITLQGYVAKTYDELKALAISDNRFELVEDEDGNISELKVTKLTSTDTEHYTADNNNQQTLTESGNLTSPIDQTVKLLVQGGDNDNIAATKTITLPSGAEITVNAATSGEDGNNIQIVFVVGGTRGIDVVEGSTIIITLTYESGDDLSDCTGELNSVDNLITYNIDVDGALSDDSGFLTGGFTPKLTISEVIFNNQSLFAMAINSSFLIIYIRQNAAYTQPTDAAEWAALLVTMTKLGAMELKETQLLINPETIEQDTGNKKAVLYKAVFQARDLNYTPETAAEYTASWENQEVDILIHDSTQGYAIMVPEIILHATEKANSGAVSYLELKAEKTGISKNTLRDLFDVPE